ncbi:hypothetical protein ACFY9C_12315 [Streptomyces filamentosus]|uniref:hypothetical protein n=1 Tax=Streptomyces filamentosus TaxID=67294 RepID=UPI0036F08B56
MDMDDPQDVGAAFWAQVHGFTVVEGPAPPDTPLGRVRAFAAAHGEEAVTEEHVRAAIEGRPLPAPGTGTWTAPGTGTGNRPGTGDDATPPPSTG